MEQFVRRSSATFATQVVCLLFGVVTSVLVARILGPEGKGLFALCVLSSLIITHFFSLGVAPATTYYLADRRFPLKEVLGNNLLLAGGLGGGGVLVGLIVVLGFRSRLFPDIPAGYLCLSLALVPVLLAFFYLQAIFLGLQRFREYNASAVLRAASFLCLAAVVLLVFRAGIWGALVAAVLAWLAADIALCCWAKKVASGVDFRFNGVYLRSAIGYGIRAHLGSVLSFLNYRLDAFLVNWLLGPAAVGFYSISVLLAEKIWLVSNAAGAVLFPRVAAEKDPTARKRITPKVIRSVLVVSVLSALVLFLAGRWLIVLLFSERFLPAAGPLRILLLGVIAFSLSRIMSNDIAARGRPILNTYVAAGTLVLNILLNLFLIPRYGIEGAAGASTVSYLVTLVARLFIYCRLSGNTWRCVLLPQRGDWTLYRRAFLALGASLSPRR